MIVVPQNGEAHLVTQNDHARLAAEILRLWQRPRVDLLSTGEDLLFATREHDNGWRETDAAPHLHSSRDRAHDFLSLPESERIEIWRRGTSRYLADRPYAALLITEHARNLFGAAGKPGRPAKPEAGPEHDTLAAFVVELEERRKSLLELTACPPGDLERDYGLLHLVDFLSLVLSHGGRAPFAMESFEISGTRGRLVAAGLLLEPFPLAGATTFWLPYRVVPIRPYQGDRELAVTLAKARWRRQRLRILSTDSDRPVG